MHATFRLFPWDVEGDPHAAARLRADGVERVALAATYHGARAITPRHPRHRVVDLPESASYLREPSPLPRGAFSFEDARDELDRAGVRVDTWAVIGHLDGGASSVPRVENAFGDRMRHAPCLSQASTRSFLRELVRVVAEASSDATVHLEAVGWQGLGHGSLHDKLHGADLDDTATELLATCVCEACADAIGLDPLALAAAVRRAVDQAMQQGDRTIEADAASAEPLVALRRYRSALAAEVASELVGVALDSGADAVSLLADETVGTLPPVERLVDCWGTVDRGVDALERAGGGTAYVDILAGEPDGFAEHWRRLTAAGARHLHVYHAGLASTRRVRAAVAAAGSIR